MKASRTPDSRLKICTPDLALTRSLAAIGRERKGEELLRCKADGQRTRLLIDWGWGRR